MASGFWDGSFTDYGTAVGTLGLAAITASVAWREGRERKTLKAERDAAQQRSAVLESERTEREARATRRSLAEGVSCYLDRMTYDPDVVTMYSGDGVPIPGALMECAVIRNISHAPITKVNVLWQSAMGGDDATTVAPAGALSVVPPVATRAITRPDSMASWDRSQMRILVTFTDAGGHRWARRDDGALFSVGEGGTLGEREM